MGKGLDALFLYFQAYVQTQPGGWGKLVRPLVGGPTWRNSRGSASCLDYVFFTKFFSLKAGRLLPVFFSDPDGLLFKVRSCAPVFGPGFWILNNSILKEDSFLQLFQVFFRGLLGLRPMCSGVIEWWEFAKEWIKDFCSSYCKKKAWLAKRWVLRLQRILELECASGNCGDGVNQRACDSLEEQLRVVFEGRARAYLYRACRDFLEKHETCFFQLYTGG